MRIKKLAGGGLPAFVSYTNVEQALPAYAGIGSGSASAESTSSSSKSSSSKSESSGDIGLLNKEMQKILMENGLPSDVLYFLQKADIFGNSIDPLDPHAQERVYTKLLTMIPEIKMNKAAYDEAMQHAKEKGTLDQTAVTNDGKIFILNKETGQIQFADPRVKLDDDKFERVSNGQLLQMRAYLPGHAMDKGNFTTLVAQSISFSDIEKSIADKIDKLEKSTISQEGYIRKDSKNAELLKGYEQIIGQGEDGVYKITSKTVSQNKQAKAFLSHLSKSLSKQEKAVLMNRASENGTTIDSIIIDLLQGRLQDETDIKVDFDKTATNGANTDENGNKTDNINKIPSTAASRFFMGAGQKSIQIFRQSDGNTIYQAYGNQSFVPDANGNPMGKQLTLSDLSISGLQGGIDLSQVSFGGIPLSRMDGEKVMIDGDKIVAIELPYTEVNGRIVPEIDKMNAISQILKESENLISQGNFEEVNQKFRQIGLQDYFLNDGTINNKFYKRFAVLNAYTDESVIDNGTEQYGIVGEYSDASDYEIGNVVSFLKERNKKVGLKYNPSKPNVIGISLPFTSENIVKSMIFIPINEDAVSWYQGTMTSGQAQQLDTKSQQRQSYINMQDAVNRYKPTKNIF